MMTHKTSLLLACALTFGIAVPVWAAEKTAGQPTQEKGTITAWDGAAKLVTIKSDTGKSKSFAWNEKTKVQGVAKLGEHVTVSYETDEVGKTWATLIRVDPVPAASKAPREQ